MSFTYFLGANSKDGFASLYTSFPVLKGTKLHIIKGGPGCGKSSFMRRIGKEAERRGLRTECVLCSGDPDSLDGLYIEELNQAWVDGTAPHVTEPKVFGVDADYINLGQFVSCIDDETSRQKLSELSSSYKALYNSAYNYLNAAGSLREIVLPSFLSGEEYSILRKRISGIIKRSIKERVYSLPCVRECFLSANSCDGLIRLGASIKELCKQVVEIDNRFNCASRVIELAAEEASRLDLQVIVGRSPLCPEQAEAVLIPECSLAFIRGDWGFDKVRHIRIDSLIAADLQRGYRQEIKEAKQIEDEILCLAFEKLQQAKALHDKLEQEYRPYIDFEAVDRFFNEYISALFM